MQMRKKGAGNSRSADLKNLKLGSSAGKPANVYPDSAGSLLAESLTGTSNLPPLAEPGPTAWAASVERDFSVAEDEI